MKFSPSRYSSGITEKSRSNNNIKIWIVFKSLFKGTNVLTSVLTITIEVHCKRDSCVMIDIGLACLKCCSLSEIIGMGEKHDIMITRQLCNIGQKIFAIIAVIYKHYSISLIQQFLDKCLGRMIFVTGYNQRNLCLRIKIPFAILDSDISCQISLFDMLFDVFVDDTQIEIC